MAVKRKKRGEGALPKRLCVVRRLRGMLSSLDPKCLHLSRVKGSHGIAPCLVYMNFPGLGH